MSEAEIEHTTMLLRAQLASKKGFTSMRELTKEYYELNGDGIPYAKFGCRTLVEFLQSHPDKFQINRDHMTNEFSVQAVIDSEIADLRRLVSGQKSSKKKKKSNAAMKMNMSKKPSYFNHRFGFNYNSHSHMTMSYNNKPQQRQQYQPTMTATSSRTAVYNNSYTSEFVKYSWQKTNTNSIKPLYSPLGSNQSKPPLPPQQQQQQLQQQQLQTKKPDLNNKNGNPNSNPNRINTFSPTLSVRSVASNSSSHHNMILATQPDFQQLFINAAYYLKSHAVNVAFVEDCQKFFIRLEGNGFSTEYETMKQELSRFYATNNHSMRLVEFERKAICVALESNSFYRVQIKKIATEQVECYYLDEGRTVLLNKSALYRIKDDFLKVQFQAIKVYISRFDKFFNCDYLKRKIQEAFSNKTFLAKRTSLDPLTVSLYDSQNSCVTDAFATSYSHFFSFKPVQGECFNSYITYMSDDTSQVFLQNPSENKEFLDILEEINSYYTELESKREMRSILNETTRSKLKELKTLTTISNTGLYLFAAKWDLDNRWYRAKFVREAPGDKVHVVFVDYGNRELISLNDLLIIPAKFALFASLPPQCFPVVVKDMPKQIEESWTDSDILQFEVIRINAALNPEVRIIPKEESAKQTPKSTEQTPTVSDGENQLVKAMNTLKLAADEEDWNEVKVEVKRQEEQQQPEKEKEIKVEKKLENENEPLLNVAYEQLGSADLAMKSQIKIKTIINPSDFIINLAQDQTSYNELIKDIETFYSNKLIRQDYLAKTLVKGQVYVAQKADSTFIRVRLQTPNTISDYKRLSCYDIDRGGYEPIDSKSIYYITRRFLKLKPLAIKAQLYGIAPDRDDQWSLQAKSYFKVLLNYNHTFDAYLKNFDAKSDVYLIELKLSNEQPSINQQMITAGMAKKL